jgi:AcrR family transcriptional regulator
MKEVVKVRRPRGRPRSETAKLDILRAARELLEEGGPGFVTMEAVAARAGVGKPTVYRWWPDRHAVSMAALMDEQGTKERRVAHRSALGALRTQLLGIAHRFSTSTGRHITSMLAASDTESELSKAFRSHFVLARRAEGVVLLKQAVAQGEVRPTIEIEVAVDILYGPLFFRLLVGHAPLTPTFIEHLLREALHGMSSAQMRTIKPPAHRRKKTPE